MIVLYAAGITAAVCLAITLFAIQTKVWEFVAGNILRVHDSICQTFLSSIKSYLTQWC